MTRQARFILISVPLACIAMGFVETVLCPGYWVKALIRILLFGGAIAAFSLYHVSILSGWFPLWLFCLLLAGLFLCGLLFNWLDRRGSLWPSWLLHAAANAAINTIGLWMFGIF